MKSTGFFLLVATLVLSTKIFAQQSDNLQADLASKLADYVIHDYSILPAPFNIGLKDEGTEYKLRFFKDQGQFYEIEVWNYKNGRQILTLNYYMTNQRFKTLDSPADLVADELIWGTPKIYIEEHITDSDSTGNVYSYQLFTKKRDLTHDGFTKWDRDNPKRSGVREYLLVDGKVYIKNKTRKASVSEIAEAQEAYNSSLLDISSFLGIK